MNGYSCTIGIQSHAWLLPLVFFFQLCKSSLELYFCFTSNSFSFLSVYTYIIMDNYKLHFTISIAWWNSSDSLTSLPPVINYIMYIACIQLTQVMVGYTVFSKSVILFLNSSFSAWAFACCSCSSDSTSSYTYNIVLHAVVDSSFNIVCTFSCSALCLSCFSFSNCSISTRLSLQQQQVTMTLHSLWS